MKILFVARSTHLHFKSGGLESHLKNLCEGLVSIDNNKIDVLTTSLPENSFINKFSDKSIENFNILHESNIRYLFLKDTTPGFYPFTLWQRFLLIPGILKDKYGIPIPRALNKRVSKEGTKNFFVETANYINKYSDYDLIVSQSTAARGIILNQNLIVKLPKTVAIIHGTIMAEIKNRFSNNKTFKNWVRFLVMDLPEWLIEKYTTTNKFFNKIDHIVAVSNMLKNQFLEEYPKLANKIDVIYNGIDDSKFKNTGKKFDTFTLLYVGRMDREKGVDIILESLKILIDRKLKLHLILIGNGVHTTEFRKYVNQNNLSDYVQFLSEIDNNKAIEYYQKSDIFVFPSRRQEGHPMTISEAFCCGLPVIASRNGGLNELIQDNITGLHIEALSANELASKIEILYKDPELLLKMSKSAESIGKEKYSRSAMSKSYDKVFKHRVV